MKGFSARAGNQAGFTLIEMLVASLVMVVGIVGILAVFPHAYRTTNTAGRRSILNHLAAGKIEYLRSLEYADAELTPGIHPDMEADSSSQNFYPVPGLEEHYSLRWRVLDGPTDSGGTPEPDMKTIIVEATFLTRYTGSETPILTGQSLGVGFQTYRRE